jgi:hypothetical protein
VIETKKKEYLDEMNVSSKKTAKINMLEEELKISTKRAPLVSSSRDNHA